MIPSDVDHVLKGMDEGHRASAMRVRKLILDAAQAQQILPLEETLKWGQPAYVPPKKKGTTIRLGIHGAHLAMFVHCQTDLVGRWRTQFPDEFTYDGNRAVLLPEGADLNEDALYQMICMALNYHADKRAKTS